MEVIDPRKHRAQEVYEEAEQEGEPVGGPASRLVVPSQQEHDCGKRGHLENEPGKVNKYPVAAVNNWYWLFVAHAEASCINVRRERGYSLLRLVNEPVYIGTVVGAGNDIVTYFVKERYQKEAGGEAQEYGNKDVKAEPARVFHNGVLPRIFLSKSYLLIPHNCNFAQNTRKVKNQLLLPLKDYWLCDALHI